MSAAVARTRTGTHATPWPVGRVAAVVALALGGALAWPRLGPAVRIACGADALVASGVRVAGVSVGGMTADQAREALRRTAADPDRSRVFFRTQGRTWALTWRQAGVSADIPAAVRRSLAVARTGSWPERLGGLVAGLVSRHDVPLGYRLDEGQAQRALVAVSKAAGLKAEALDEEGSLAAFRTALARGGTIVVPLVLRPAEGGEAESTAADPEGAVIGGATVETAHLTPRQRANLAAACAQLGRRVVAAGETFRLTDGLHGLDPQRGYVLAEPLPPCPAAVCLGAGVELLRDAVVAAWRDAGLPATNVAPTSPAGAPYDPLQGAARLVNDTDTDVVVRATAGARSLFVKLYGNRDAGGPAVEAGRAPTGAQAALGDESQPGSRQWDGQPARQGDGDSLADRPAAGSTADSRSPAPAPSAQAGPQLTVVAVGDVQLAGSAQAALKAQGAPAFLGAVARELGGADLAVANLECVVSNRTGPGPLKHPEDVAAQREWLFRVAPAVAEPLLKVTGVDYFSLANNHSLDYGVPGLADTGRELSRLGIGFGGAGGNISEATRPVSDEVAPPPGAAAAASPARANEREATWASETPSAGTSVAVLSYAAPECVPDASAFAATRYQPGVALVGTGPDGRPTAAAVERLRADLGAAAETHDVVICLFHWGVEGDHAVTAGQRALAHLAVDAGADLVVGHHPHVLQTLECYRGKLIAYSLGNFIFSPPKPEQRETGLLRVRFDKGALAGADFLPAAIVGCAPRLLAPEQEALRRRIADRLLGTPLPEG